MATILEGFLDATGKSFGIVVTRWNDFITNKLLDGALDALRRHRANDDNVTIAYCPGSFEIPLVTGQMAKSGKFDAIIALGAVIRGATPHFDYVASEAAKGVAQAAIHTGVPCAFGILTTDTIEQAIERAGTKAGNKGYEAACTAIEMASLNEALNAI